MSFLLKKNNNNKNLIGKVFFISFIKISDCSYNLKYIIDNVVNTVEYKGYLYFDLNINNLDLIYQINHLKFGKWYNCLFDYRYVLLGVCN